MCDILKTYDSVTLRIDLVSHSILKDGRRLDVFIPGVEAPISLYGFSINEFKKDWLNWCNLLKN